MGQKPATSRKLSNSRQVPIKIDTEDALHRAVARAQDMAQDRLDPQPGPVEDRSRALRHGDHK